MADTIYPIRINISPLSTTTVNGRIIINIKREPLINLSDKIISSSFNFLNVVFDNYIDEERELKTLLNYGEDRQSVIIAKRYGDIDTSGVKKIQLKLLQPVPDDVFINTTTFVSRELAKSTIDKVRVRFAPALDNTPYLRPKNLSVKANLDTGKILSNVNLEQLVLVSGSVGANDIYKNRTFEDEIFRKWYSFDFNSAELNINFQDYKNFVFYSSAAMRLQAFREKLRLLESVEGNRNQFLSSSTYLASSSYAGFVFVNNKTADFAKQKEDIIRGFDRYEQYLYFTPTGSDSPYTASAYYADNGIEYNSIGYWPKSGSQLWPVSSTVASDWYDTQLAIAHRYDEFNENNLVNTIPSYLREDIDSSAYVTFISMIGHFFDMVKIYVDQYPYIYNRDLDPDEGLSKDLINEIAESVGFTLPTLNSIYSLSDNIIGSGSVQPRRDLTAEIYKRLLHNLPFFVKSKGSKTALDTFLRTFGITPQLITVKETGRPVTSSVYSFDEYTTGLDFDESSIKYVVLPIAASGRIPKLLQFNCTVAKTKEMTLLTGDDKWALNVVPHPTNNLLGRFEIKSGSTGTTILSSSYGEFFGDELLNISIDVGSSETALRVLQTENEDIIFDSNTVESTYFKPLWDLTQYVYMGGSGPRVSSRYDGTLDEVRLWNKQLSDEVVLNTALDPGSNAGDTYEDAATNLIAQLSFNNLNTSSFSSSLIVNESPYKDISVAPSMEYLFAFNLSGSDFIRYNRTVSQKMANAGTSGYVTSKITIAPPPQFTATGDGLQTLRRTTSIVAPEIKRIQRGRSKVIVAAAPTDIINQNIIRNFGLENINSVLGSPTTLYKLFDKSLQSLKTYYQRYYYVDVDTNKFIRILSELGSVLDQVVDYFIPSKATALRGIVIEPNILEQVKIPPIQNIRFYGKDTRKTIDAANSLTGSSPDYGATFNLSKNVIVSDLRSTTGSHPTFKTRIGFDDEAVFRGNVPKYTSSIDTPSTTTTASFNTILYASIPSGSYVAKKPISIAAYPVVSSSGDSKFITSSVQQPFVYIPTASINIIDEKTQTWIEYEKNVVSSSIFKKKLSNFDVGISAGNKIGYNDTNKGSPGAEPYNRVYTRKLFNYEIQTTRLGGNTSLYIPALREIPPSADFRDVGVYTYFNNPDGIYYFPEVFKTPAYPQPLNQENLWNSTKQSFTGIATWSYGSEVTIHDVVYQNVTYEDTSILGEEIVNSAKFGNQKYYVFKNRPEYRNPGDGTRFYLNKISTFLPPSIDTENWDLLKFKPNQRQGKRRVVFDTFVIPDPADNNYKTTTISIDKLLDIPARYNDRVAFPLVSANDLAVGEFILQNISALLAVQSTVGNIRMRLYRTAADRNSDLSRTIYEKPTGAHGVLLDVVIEDGNTVQLVGPIATLIAGDSPENGKIYYTLNNLDANIKSNVYVYFYYFALQIEPRVPQGYLRKHYRFFKDNSTATRRRNYEGCKNTEDTTIDGLPPIQVFLAEGNDLIISPTSTNQEIVTGGGGTLNVT